MSKPDSGVSKAATLAGQVVRQVKRNPVHLAAETLDYHTKPIRRRLRRQPSYQELSGINAARIRAGKNASGAVRKEDTMSDEYEYVSDLAELGEISKSLATKMAGRLKRKPKTKMGAPDPSDPFNFARPSGPKPPGPSLRNDSLRAGAKPYMAIPARNPHGLASGGGHSTRYVSRGETFQGGKGRAGID